MKRDGKYNIKGYLRNLLDKIELEDTEDSDLSLPMHNACGLPVELCTCIDATIKFFNGRFIDVTDYVTNGKGTFEANCVCGYTHLAYFELRHRIKEKEDIFCPSCGRLITTLNIGYSYGCDM